MTKKNNLRNNYLLSLGEILSRIPMIFTIGYLAKSVGPEAFGAWSLILVVQALMTSLGGAGLASALIRFGPNAERNVAYEYIILSIKRSAIFLGIISILVYIFYDNIGAFLNINPEYRWLLMASSIMTIGSILDGHLDKYFKARLLINKQITYVFSRTIAEVVAVICVFYFMNFSHASKAIFLYIIIVVTIKVLIYPWLFLEKNTEIKNRIKLDTKNTFLNFAYMLIPSILLAWLIIQIDRIILGWMLSPIEFGVYAFSATLSSYIVFISYSIMPLFQSHSAIYYDKGEFQQLQNLFEIWQYIFLSVTTIIMLILIFFSQEILSVTAGLEYSKIPHILILLCAAVSLDQFFTQYQLIFNLAKKPKYSTLVHSIKLIILAILIPIFVFFFGINGAAFGIIASVLIVNLVRYKIATKLVKIELTLFIKINLISVILLLTVLSYLQNFIFLSKPIFLIILTLSIGIFFFIGRKKLSYFRAKLL